MPSLAACRPSFAPEASMTITELLPSTWNVWSGRTHTAAVSSMPTPSSSGCSRITASSRFSRWRLMKCWSTMTPRKKPRPGFSSTVSARITVKSPSPVIIGLLWHAVPAEVPPTTAPRSNAAAIAAPTGVPSSAFVIRTWSPPPKKIPRGPDRQLGQIGAHRVGLGLDVEEGHVGAAVLLLEELDVVRARVGLLGGGRDRHDRRLRPARQLDELRHRVLGLVAAADEDQVAPGSRARGERRRSAYRRTEDCKSPSHFEVSLWVLAIGTRHGRGGVSHPGRAHR